MAGAPLWSDEYFSWRSATQPTLAHFVLRVSGVDIYPPLAYLGPWILARFTDAIAVLRLPSALAGVACVAVAARLAARLGGARAGLLAALLTAALPLSVYYGWEAKAYNIFALFVLLMLDEALRMLREPGRGHRWLALWVACAGYSFWFSIYYVAALLAAAAWAAPRERWLPLLRGAAWGTALQLPLAPFFLKTLLVYREPLMEAWPMLLLLTLQDFAMGFWMPWGLSIAGGALAGWLGLRFARTWPDRSDRALLGAFIGLPPLVCFLMTAAFKPSYSDRAMLASAFALMVAAALGLSRLQPRRALLWALPLVLLQILSVAWYQLDAGVRRADWDAPRLAIAAELRPGDLVMHTTLYSVHPFQMAYEQAAARGESVPPNLMPVAPPHSFPSQAEGIRQLWRQRAKPWLQQRGIAVDAGLDPIFSHGPALQAQLDRAQRIWLVAVTPSAVFRQQSPAMALRLSPRQTDLLNEPVMDAALRGFREVRRQESQDATVSLYVRQGR